VTGRRALWLVIARELRQTFHRRTFWITVGIALVASSLAVTLPDIIGGDRTSYDIAVVGGEPSLRSDLRAVGGPLDADVTVRGAGSPAAARSAVDDGDVSLAVLADRAEPSVVVQSGEHEQLVAFVQAVLTQRQLAERLADAGLDRADIDRVLRQRPVPVDERKADEDSRRGTAAIISVALYILLLMLTIQVAGGTAIEKANRISEVLLAIVRPAPLLFGKVIAIGLIGFLTLVAGATPVLVKLGAGGDLPAGLGAAIGAGAAWFVLGVALYLTIAGALGALVERQEEAGSAVSPLSIILIGSYLVGQSAPDSALGGVLSVLPLTSTMTMPPRIAMGIASPASIVLSLVLGLASVVLVVRVGAVVYRRAVVRTGRRLKLGEVLRA
jgi:ABC-2 type transport system permease protein